LKFSTKCCGVSIFRRKIAIRIKRTTPTTAGQASTIFICSLRPILPPKKTSYRLAIKMKTTINKYVAAPPIPDLLAGNCSLQIRGSKLETSPPRIPEMNLRTNRKVRFSMIIRIDKATFTTSIKKSNLTFPKHFVIPPWMTDPSAHPKENRKPNKLLVDFYPSSSFLNTPFNSGSEQTLKMAN
jgi:hypothetical protein